MGVPARDQALARRVGVVGHDRPGVAPDGQPEAVAAHDEAVGDARVLPAPEEADGAVGRMDREQVRLRPAAGDEQVAVGQRAQRHHLALPEGQGVVEIGHVLVPQLLRGGREGQGQRGGGRGEPGAGRVKGQGRSHGLASFNACCSASGAMRMNPRAPSP